MWDGDHRVRMTVHFPKAPGASAAMKGRFPTMALAISPPLTPMEAQGAAELPRGAGWQYEPKWDGLRCLAFRDGRTVVLQSKSGEPLTRYFPEIMMALSSLPEQRFALDGEIVVIGGAGRLSYDDLMGRIHPSARKVAQLSARTPATLLAFDLLAEGADSLLALPLGDRRKRLESFFKTAGPTTAVQLSPATIKRPEALGWLKDLGGAGLDGLVAKQREAPYRPGERDAMVKVKLERTAECVVAGVRRATDGGSAGLQLLLGLHDSEGLLHYVGTTAALDETTVKGLGKLLDPLLDPRIGGVGFTGRQPPNKPGIAGPKGRDFEPLRPSLVAEVRYDRFVGERFRSAPGFVRWRPDKKPCKCTIAELRPTKAPKGPGLERLGL